MSTLLSARRKAALACSCLQAGTPPPACRRRRRHADAGTPGPPSSPHRRSQSRSKHPAAGGGERVRLAGLAHACGGGPARHAPSCGGCRVPRPPGAIWRPPTCVSASLSFPSFSTLNRQKPAALSKSSSMAAGGWRMRRCTAAGCWVPQGAKWRPGRSGKPLPAGLHGAPLRRPVTGMPDLDCA